VVPPGHPTHDEWNGSLRSVDSDVAVGEEACHADCTGCDAALCVVIRFRGLVPERASAVSREEDWPAGYPR
jgi:hypothetical protein